MNKVKIVDNKNIYPVDAIYILLLVDSDARRKNINKFLSLLNSGNNIKIVETVRKPWLKSFIGKSIKYDNYRQGDETARALDCAINHYNIIKSSYEKGLERIMVIEDDANFVCGINDYIDIINDIPDDADILQFRPEEITINNFRKNLSWLDYKTYDTKLKLRNMNMRWSTIMYILNRDAMKYFIDYYDNNMIIADQPFFDYKSNLKYYVCNKPVLSVRLKSNILDY